MQAAEFDRLVAAACERIPARFRKRLKNVAMIVEAEPQPAQAAARIVSSRSLGKVTIA